MNFAYVDSSVLLRILLRENLPNIDLTEFDDLYSSEIAELECRRVLDRIRIKEKIPDEELALRLLELKETFESINIIRISRSIMKRACESFPVVVRSLDSIHLASFIAIQKTKKASTWKFLTHDIQLVSAARALGYEVDSG